MLEQFRMGSSDDCGQGLGDRPVVHGVGQPVGGAGGPEVELEVQVHLEGLGPLPLLRQRAVDPEDPKAPELDSIRVNGFGRRLRTGHPGLGVIRVSGSSGSLGHPGLDGI
jgi:hypothetical protein